MFIVFIFFQNIQAKIITWRTESCLKKLAKLVGLKVDIKNDRSLKAKVLKITPISKYQLKKTSDDKAFQIIYDNYLSDKGKRYSFNEMAYFSSIFEKLDQTDWNFFSYEVRDAFFNLGHNVRNFSLYLCTSRLYLR